MRLHWECPCETAHELEGPDAEELSGCSTDVHCDCGAVYAVSVTVLRPPGAT
jgi:hypothetical protein